MFGKAKLKREITILKNNLKDTRDKVEFLKSKVQSIDEALFATDYFVNNKYPGAEFPLRVLKSEAVEFDMLFDTGFDQYRIVTCYASKKNAELFDSVIKKSEKAVSDCKKDQSIKDKK